jgi:hypothetical protein
MLCLNCDIGRETFCFAALFVFTGGLRFAVDFRPFFNEILVIFAIA